MNVSVTPIIPSRERKPEEEASQQRKCGPSKVVECVLERISQAKGGLLPSAMAPQIAIDLLPAFESVKGRRTSNPKRKSKLRKMPLARNVPIGLRSTDPEDWINALMQFILFVPGFAELFFFAPRSFHPFQEFIDQYHHDQQEGRLVSSADGLLLLQFFRSKFPDLCFLGKFSFLIQVLHPKWEVCKTLDEALQKGTPPDLFVSESSLKKQQFIQSDLCYDLDAFIELRSDGKAASLIAYVKMGGGWYQCDNDRITLLRSNSLTVPLSRALLLHYRLMHFTKTGWN